MAAQSHSPLSRITNNIVLRTATYYFVLLGVAALLWQLPSTKAVMRESLEALVSSGGFAGFGQPSSFQGMGSAQVDAGTLALTVAIAMIGAVLLALPVAWIYTLTRHRRGYQQSVVQALMVLPPLVAGVVVLVKYSLALAFSLAGIVAAVRFRNTLEDSKDAVYIFLATAIGLAAAVQLPVAAVISVVFNVIALALWYTDFGRRELEEDDMQRRDAMLRLRTYDPDSSRIAVESVFDDYLKRWRLGGVLHESDGTHVVEYAVQLKKSARSSELLDALQAKSQVIGVELK